ncbi:Regulator of Chromosome Condensation (RCC1) repeat protein [Rhodococcus sp. AG1013]|nr:Regulator of Chromosome Condensation (RCC1) repeat protein [Rhodococcus sp. AG1013]
MPLLVSEEPDENGDLHDAGMMLFEDTVTTPGRIIATTLDPTYHHGNNFMPGSTRFLYALLRWLDNTGSWSGSVHQPTDPSGRPSPASDPSAPVPGPSEIGLWIATVRCRDGGVDPTFRRCGKVQLALVVLADRHDLPRRGQRHRVVGARRDRRVGHSRREGELRTSAGTPSDDLSAGGQVYTDIAVGGGHSLLLRSDGRIVAIGRGDNYQQTIVPALPEGVTVTAVAAGMNHSVALRSDGQVLAFGKSTEGQLLFPPAPEGTRYLSVAAGEDFSLAVRTLAPGGEDPGEPGTGSLGSLFGN